MNESVCIWHLVRGVDEITWVDNTEWEEMTKSRVTRKRDIYIMSIALQTMDILGGMATELTGNPENKVFGRKWENFIEIVRMTSVATEVMSGNKGKVILVSIQRLEVAPVREAVGMIRQQPNQSVLDDEGERSMWKTLAYLLWNEGKMWVTAKARYKITHYILNGMR